MIAFQRLQEFHRRSLGEYQGSGLQLPVQLSVDQARYLYVHGLMSALGQFLVMADDGRQQQFRDLLDFIANTGSFDGLESLFLSGLNSVGVLEENDLFQRGVLLWNQFGPPSRLGGGFNVSFFADTMADTLSLVGFDAINSLGIGRSNNRLLFPGPGMAASIKKLLQGLTDIPGTKPDSGRPGGGRPLPSGGSGGGGGGIPGDIPGSEGFPVSKGGRVDLGGPGSKVPEILGLLGLGGGTETMPTGRSRKSDRAGFLAGFSGTGEYGTLPGQSGGSSSLGGGEGGLHA